MHDLGPRGDEVVHEPTLRITAGALAMVMELQIGAKQEVDARALPFHSPRGDIAALNARFDRLEQGLEKALKIDRERSV